MAEERPPLKVTAVAVGFACAWLALWSVMTVPLDSARSRGSSDIVFVRGLMGILSSAAWGLAVAYVARRVRGYWVIVPAAVLTAVAPCMLCVFFTEVVDDVHQARSAEHVLPMLEAEIPGVVQPSWHRFGVVWRGTDPRHAEADFGLKSGPADALAHLRKTLPRNWIEIMRGDPDVHFVRFRSPIVNGRRDILTLFGNDSVSARVVIGALADSDPEVPTDARRLDGRVPRSTDPERY